MRSTCRFRAITGALVALVLTVAVTAAVAGGSATRTKATAPAAPALAPPVVADTRTNLQKAFAEEMNAKERYTTFAKQADREGYRAVAQLFRACATSEQIHGDRIVHAIAVTGGEARVLLDQVFAGSTQANLESEIQSEEYDGTQFYPAYLARARADGVPAAVRCLTFALAGERDHVRLLQAALANLAQRPEPYPLYVCPYCGRTVLTPDAKKCPNCFTDAHKFIRIGEEAKGKGPAAAAPVTAGEQHAAPVPALRK